MSKPAGIVALATRGWVSLAQFARLVGVSYPTALKLMRNKDVQTVPVGSVHRVYRDEVERFLREGNRSGEVSRKTSFTNPSDEGENTNDD